MGTESDYYRIEMHDGADYLVWRWGSGSTVEIFDIVVNCERRKGVGRELVDTLLHRIPSRIRLVWAITRADNQIAQQFYEALNFRRVGVMREFYRDNPNLVGSVDAVWYGLDVGESLRKP